MNHKQEICYQYQTILWMILIAVMSLIDETRSQPINEFKLSWLCISRQI